MKKISLFLVCSLILQSFAWAGPKESLKAILDEYRFALTVEWDQRDHAELQKMQAKFSEEFNKLVKEENLSAKDLTVFLKENSRDLNLDESVLASLENGHGELDVERAQRLLNEKADLLYMQGSSWAPEEVLVYGFLGLLILEVIVLAITYKDDPCPNPEYHPNNVPYTCIYE